VRVGRRQGILEQVTAMPAAARVLCSTKSAHNQHSWTALGVIKLKRNYGAESLNQNKTTTKPSFSRRLLRASKLARYREVPEWICLPIPEQTTKSGKHLPAQSSFARLNDTDSHPIATRSVYVALPESQPESSKTSPTAPVQ